MGNLRALVEGLKPAMAMVLVQTVFGGVNIFYKLSLNDGMDVKILVAYRNLFAIVSLGPLAFFMERKRRPKLTLKVLVGSFLCGLFGGFLTQNLYVASMRMTSATFASAMTNIAPAVTFILALLFGLEKLGIQKLSGQLKVLGTLVGISGAMLLTIYKGPEINIWSTSINLMKTRASASPHESGNRVIGSLLAVASCLAYAMWLIIQTKMTKVYPCPYSCTALMCFMASIQSVVFASCVVKDWSQWRLGFNIRLLTVAYSGVVASGLIFVVLVWCIEKKGPLFAAVFNPLMLVIVAFLASLLLNETLHLGSVLGAVLIIMGLYIVLWGKQREAPKSRDLHVDSARGSVDVVMIPGTTIDSHIATQGEEEDQVVEEKV